MTRQRILTDQEKRAIEALDAFGADLERWPVDLRSQYEDIIASAAGDSPLAAAINAAEDLDAFLGAASAPRMAEDFKNRIAASYAPPISERSLFEDFLSSWFMRRPLLPAGALAGFASLGLLTGVLTAQSSAALPPEAEAYAYLQEAYGIELSDDSEAGSWDVN